MTKDLFDQTILNKLTLPNRLFRGAVGDKALFGEITDQSVELYTNLAMGGVGNIFTGFTLVSDQERGINPMFTLYDDSTIAAHQRLITAVHEHGATIFSQLVYVGSHLSKVFPEGVEITDGHPKFLSPSGVLPGNKGPYPKAATIDEILQIQDDFAAAALRAKSAGYDGIAIHGAHGFLFSQFLTPIYNKRTDNYGGSAENRARIVVETYHKVRQAVGPDYPVILKINVRENMEDHGSLSDILEMAGVLSEAGLDALEISGNWWDYREQDRAYFLEEASVIAKRVSAKVILVGGLRDSEQINQILKETSIEYFGLARPLIKDPGLVNKFKS
jgi:2,4-dienoyl-CoA reductase-like NADH-dependent reductase (Old Yellow Enzyme family)